MIFLIIMKSGMVLHRDSFFLDLRESVVFVLFAKCVICICILSPLWWSHCDAVVVFVLFAKGK